MFRFEMFALSLSPVLQPIEPPFICHREFYNCQLWVPASCGSPSCSTCSRIISLCIRQFMVSEVTWIQSSEVRSCYLNRSTNCERPSILELNWLLISSLHLRVASQLLLLIFNSNSCCHSWKLLLPISSSKPAGVSNCLAAGLSSRSLSCSCCSLNFVWLDSLYCYILLSRNSRRLLISLTSLSNQGFYG